MAFVPVPNTYMCELLMSLHGSQVENTLYFRPTVENPDPTPVAIANALITWWTAQLAPSVSQDLSLRAVQVTDLTSATSTSYTQPAPTPNPVGGRGDQSLPANCALTVSFRTAARGRSFRGRNYVAGIVELDSGASAVNSTIALAIETAYNYLLGGGLNNPFADWEWVVVSRYSNGVERVTGVATPITSAVLVDFYVDSQRRRLPGRGR